MSISQETSPPSKSSRKKLRTSVDQLVLSTPSDTPNNDAKLSKKRRKDVEPLPAVTDAISELALVASPDNTVDVPSRRKKKHRITIEENAEAQPSSSTTVSGPPALVVAKKTKKKLRFAETVDNSAENILPASDVEQVLAPQIEKKRTKKRSETLEAEPAEEAFTSEIDSGAEQGKKRKKSQSSASDNFSVEDPPSITQSKKRKAESNPESNPLAKDRPKSSKKKRKSAVTEFPDPADDETLSEQAMKGVYLLQPFSTVILIFRPALSYAHAQVADPASWKFHKARQNWLLRNAWSESSVRPSRLVSTLRRTQARAARFPKNTFIYLRTTLPKSKAAYEM